MADAAGAPPPDVEIDVPRAQALLRGQFPELGALPLCALASGWDNAMFRLGAALVMRMPRRAVAVPLLLHEQRWLPHIQRRLPLNIPAPTHLGVPAPDYPWPWSIVPWIDGETADLKPPDAAQGATCLSAATWERARGWALLFSAVLLNAGLQGDARMRVIAERTLQNLAEGP